ncbi:MAG TPA: nucleotidyltransferase family protein [bacterium]
MTVAELLGTKRAEVLRIAERYGARNIRVFGSLARGEAGPDSDVDLLVQLDPGVTLLKHAALVRELEALLGRKVDVVSERGLRPRVRERVLRDAVPV